MADYWDDFCYILFCNGMVIEMGVVNVKCHPEMTDAICLLSSYNFTFFNAWYCLNSGQLGFF